MNCKSHLHLGKFKNFLVCRLLIIQDFCILPIWLQTNCNVEICWDRQQAKAGRAWYNDWSLKYYFLRVIYSIFKAIGPKSRFPRNYLLNKKSIRSYNFHGNSIIPFGGVYFYVKCKLGFAKVEYFLLYGTFWLDLVFFNFYDHHVLAKL